MSLFVCLKLVVMVIDLCCSGQKYILVDTLIHSGGTICIQPPVFSPDQGIAPALSVM